MLCFNVVAEYKNQWRITMRERIENDLSKMFMFPHQAKTIAEAVIDNPELEQKLGIGWHTRVHPTRHLYELVYEEVWLWVLGEAQKYINKHCPEAHFRHLFFEE